MQGAEGLCAGSKDGSVGAAYELEQFAAHDVFAIDMSILPAGKNTSNETQAGKPMPQYCVRQVGTNALRSGVDGLTILDGL